MRTDNPTVALVDAYGTGAHLRQAFADRGARLVHVWSTPEPMATMKAPDLAGYRASIVGTDPAAAARELTALGVTHVVAGQEPGVPLADTLSELLGLPTNGTASSLARRDKYLMIEAVRAAGLRCAGQRRSGDVEEIVAAAARLGYPAVVKPLAGSGSQGVAICADEEQVRQATHELLGTTTMYGQTNTEVLVQSYLDGPEYVVDTVSRDGERYTNAVWRHVKVRHGTRNIYHLDVLADPGDPGVAELVAYTDAVLDALGVRHGAAHAEVIMTAAGPALVEVGARLNGVAAPEFDRGCTGADQAGVAALAYLDPGRFRREFAGRTYRRSRHAFLYEVRTELDGRLARLDDGVLAEIDGLESVRRRTMRVRAGGRIRPTVDLPSSPMLVYLSHESRAALVRDQDRVAELARSAYHLEPANTKQEAILSS
jgi:hypothetical protein